MRVALDTNRYADFARNVPQALDVIQRVSMLFLPFVVLAELRAGFVSGARAHANEARLAEFLAADRVAVLWPDDATTRMYAELAREMRDAGTPIPSNDLWIAAVCIQHNVQLFSRDRHFEVVQRLPRI